MVYMCAVVDLCGKMVLAYHIGSDMTATLVTDTIREAKQKEMVLMDYPSTVTRGLNTPHKHILPDTSIPHSAVNVKPWLSVRQCCNGKFLWNAEI